MHRFLLVVLLMSIAACPKDRGGGGGAQQGAAARRDASAIDAPAPYRRSTVMLTAAGLAPATLDWEHPVMTRMELERALAGGEPPRGRRVISFQHGGWQPYDDAAQQLVFEVHGLEGMDLDPPVAFVPDPPITVGSLPGPVGGSVKLHISALPASASVVRATADAVLEGDADDPVLTQFLVEIADAPATIDGADYWPATLHGVRLVRAGARLVLLEGAPSPPAN